MESETPKSETPKPEEPKPKEPEEPKPKPEGPEPETPKPEIPAPEGPKPEEPEPKQAPDVPRAKSASDVPRTKSASEAPRASSASELPRASLVDRVRNELRELNLVWIAIGIPVFMLASVAAWFLLSVLAFRNEAAALILSIAVFTAGGVVLGRFAKGRAILQSGISAALLFILNSLIFPRPDLPQHVDDLAWVLGGITVLFDLGVVGALLGDALKPRAEGTPDTWDRAASWLAKYGAIPALVQLTIVIAIVHAHVFAGETVGDDLSFHFAESARLADCLRVGDFDFWNPSANAGYASAYYYQVIPQLASAIPAAIFGHHLFFFQLSVWLPHVAAPLCAYKGMRLLGATPWQSVVAAFAVAFMNGESRWGAGNAGTFQVGLYTQTWALAAFPLALGYGARWMSEAKGLAPAIAWSVFVMLCHPFAGIVLGLGLFTSLVAGVTPRLTPVHWPSIVGRALIMLGVAELLLIPPDLARLSFLPFGPLPELFAHIVGYTLIAVGLALPFALRPKDVSFELGAFGTARSLYEPGAIGEGIRIIVLGFGLFIGTMPVWLPLLADMNGFGGFPHRVWDEIGPGFGGLATWYKRGAILDFANPDQINRVAILTWTLPAVLLLLRSRMMRWFWPPALLFATLLALGPHLGKIGDDLFPPVRALGAMQIVLALGIGAGVMIIGKQAWDAPVDSRDGKFTRGAILGLLGLLAVIFIHAVWGNFIFTIIDRLHLPFVDPLLPRILITVAVVAVAALTAVGIIPLWKALSNQYGVRTALSAIAAALAVLVAVPGARALGNRVIVLEDYPNNYRDEMMKISSFLGTQPGRKQPGPGAENHWWNMLSYAYDRVPSTLQMGGGGLQASPNYDYLWWVVTQLHDWQKVAWVYDAPYITFMKSLTNKAPSGETIFQTEHFEVRKLPSPGLVSPVHVVGYLPPPPNNGKFDTRLKALAWMYVNVVGVLPPGYRNEQLGHEGSLLWMKSDLPMKDEVIAYTGSGGPGEPPAGRLLRAWHQDSPGDEPDIVAEVEVERTTTFLVRESWHPRWRAYIDGEPTPVRRMTPDFPAVDVPPGKHTVSLRFERPWWTHLAWLAWPGVCVAAWLLTRRKKQK